MDNTLLGEIKEFKRTTEKELNDIRVKVEELIAFRWKVTGIMAVLLLALEIVGQLIRLK